MAKTLKKRTSTKSRKNVIGPLKKGNLTNCGYRVKNTMKDRRKTLKCAVKKYGGLSVFRKLNAISILNKNRNPEVSRKTKKDRNWIKKTYL